MELPKDRLSGRLRFGFKPKRFSDEMKGELTRRTRGATERSVEWSSKVLIQI